MTATKSEAKNFYWHCQVAATVAKLHKNPATKANLRHALRLATLTVAGKNGVQLASRKAYSEKHLCGKDWSACGLVKEHVIPISLLYVGHGAVQQVRKVCLDPHDVLATPA